MEKAILKTLAYGDIFDYPLKAYEIHKWLVGRKASLRQVESALGGVVKSAKCKVQNGYYFLSTRNGLVGKRQKRQRHSANYFRKAKLLTSILKAIPWIKLVGISGGLAMDNATKADDIDLFIITSKNRLWVSRILALGLLSLTGQRRKAGENSRKSAGKLCINILLEEDRLGQSNMDIYLAHEVLQMKPLWYRDGIYQKYLEENSWAFRFLPNWTTNQIQNAKFKVQNYNVFQTAFGRTKFKIVDLIENLTKWIQLKVMRKPRGMERIEDRALYFHPNDIRPKVLAEYMRKTKKLISP